MKLKNIFFGKRPGLAMLDILMAMAVLAGLVAIGMKTVSMGLNKYKSFKTESALSSLKMGLDMYMLNSGGKVPGKREGGLSALAYRPEGADWWEGPYITGYKKGAREDFSYDDAWGNPIEYNAPPVEYERIYKKYEIFSRGAEGSDKEEYKHKGA